MATSESKRVDAHRKKYFDRISSLIEKGGLALIRTLAIREGVKKAEVIRRAILARAGLRMMPYPDALEELSAVNTQEEANAAILRLQAREEGNEVINYVLEKLSPEPNSATYEMVASYDLQQIASKILESETDGKVVLTGRDIGILRRNLANAQYIDMSENQNT